MKINKFLITSLFICSLFAKDKQNILFALNKHDQSLSFSNTFELINNGNFELKKLFLDFEVTKVEPWLKTAGENECSNEICLNKIYRIKSYNGDMADFLYEFYMLSQNQLIDFPIFQMTNNIINNGFYHKLEQMKLGIYGYQNLEYILEILPFY